MTLHLIFLGDISVDSPYQRFGDIIDPLETADCAIANLEGATVSDEEVRSAPSQKAVALYNSPVVLDVLRHFNVCAVCLANNHMCDFHIPPKQTSEVLARAGIASFGAGANLVEASKPLVLRDNGTTVKLFAFGWEVIGCHAATSTDSGVNPLTPSHALGTIRRLRATDNSSFVVFVMHWNYELELYPQPAHRQLAHDLIREGVDAIIGLHSHVAQGAELVDGKPVVYSLGNWFFPIRQVGHLRLAYPPIASRELAFELEIEGRQVRDTHFHWHRFDAGRSLINFEQTEGWDGAILRQLTPYGGTSDEGYVRWFRVNRTRRRGLPVYQNYHHCWRNRIKDKYVRLRQAVIEALIHLRLKGGPRA